MQQRTPKKIAPINKHSFFFKINKEEENYLTNKNIMSFLLALEYSLTHPNMTLEKMKRLITITKTEKDGAGVVVVETPILIPEGAVIDPKNKITFTVKGMTITTNMLEEFPKKQTVSLNGIKFNLLSFAPAIRSALEPYFAPLSPENLLTYRDNDIPSLTSLCLFNLQMQLVLSYLIKEIKISTGNNNQKNLPPFFKTTLSQNEKITEDARKLPDELRNRLYFLPHHTSKSATASLLGLEPSAGIPCSGITI